MKKNFYNTRIASCQGKKRELPRLSRFTCPKPFKDLSLICAIDIQKNKAPHKHIVIIFN